MDLIALNIWENKDDQIETLGILMMVSFETTTTKLKTGCSTNQGILQFNTG